MKQDDDCKRWAEKALGIARLLEDDRLLDTLQSNYLKLTWEEI
jgi:hypothetical protein